MGAFFGSEFFFHGEIMRRSRLVRMVNFDRWARFLWRFRVWPVPAGAF